MSSSDNNPVDASTQPRRGSFTTQTFNNIFGRSNSISGAPTAPFPGPITTAAAQDQRRRMSISTLGLSGNSPPQTVPFAFGGRRGSVSTNSDSIDENAIEDDEGPGRSAPTTPFTRRMSFGAQALRGAGTNRSPGTSGESGFNWSEQLRSRAESTVSQSQRPIFSTSPTAPKNAPIRDRNKSVGELPTPPMAVPPPQARPERPKPDAFQERILKGDFYMD